MEYSHYPAPRTMSPQVKMSHLSFRRKKKNLLIFSSLKPWPLQYSVWLNVFSAHNFSEYVYTHVDVFTDIGILYIIVCVCTSACVQILTSQVHGQLFFRFTFISSNYIYIYLCLGEGMWECRNADTHKAWKRTAHPLELELQEVISHFTWVVGIELRHLFLMVEPSLRPHEDSF